MQSLRTWATEPKDQGHEGRPQKIQTTHHNHTVVNGRDLVYYESAHGKIIRGERRSRKNSEKQIGAARQR